MSRLRFRRTGKQTPDTPAGPNGSVSAVDQADLRGPTQVNSGSGAYLDELERSLAVLDRLEDLACLEDLDSLEGLEVFEQRLALSVSPGAETAMELWETLAGICRPLDPQDALAKPFLPHLAAPPPDSLQPPGLQDWHPGLDKSSWLTSGHQEILQAFDTQLTSARFKPAHAGDDLPTQHGSLLAQAEVIREEYGWSGQGQTVAVIDSGVAWDHVALGAGFGAGHRVVGGWDFAENDANPYDDGPVGYHGTHVTGLIAGKSEHLQGVAPGADIVALRVFDDFGRGSLDWIESALRWVYDHRESFESPITTVNLSLGANLPAHLLETVYAQFEDEFRLLNESEILVVAAAGNRFTPLAPDTVAYPAASEWVWAVGSMRESDTLSSFSQREDGILAAHGEQLWSAVPEHVLGWDGVVDDYQAASGTSMAAPQVAGATMVIREAAQSLGVSLSSTELLGLLVESSIPQTDPITGFTYYPVNLGGAVESLFSLASSASTDSTETPIGTIMDEKTITDLGPMDWGTITVSADTETRITAERSGWFSLRSTSETLSEIPLQIHNLSGHPLWSGTLSAETQIDLEVRAGETVHISTPILHASELHVANLVKLTDQHLDVSLGNLSIPVEVSLAHGPEVNLGLFRYDLDSLGIKTATIDGGAGADNLTLEGSSSAGRLTLNPYEDGHWYEAGIHFRLRGFEQVTYDGQGGNDRVFLYDTTGNDRLTASPGTALLEGVGFRYEVTNVARSYVHATAGGQDIAFLYDSPNDDRLAVRPQFVSLRGGEFFNNAIGFERVYAYATHGGFDKADIYDSVGNDRFTATSTSAMISGTGYYVQARLFDSVTGHAVAGGDDRATLYADETGTQRWFQTIDQITLRGEAMGERIARGFESVEAYVAGERIDLQATTIRDAIPSRASILGDFFARLEKKEAEAIETLFASFDPEKIPGDLEKKS